MLAPARIRLAACCRECRCTHANKACTHLGRVQLEGVQHACHVALHHCAPLSPQPPLGVHGCCSLFGSEAPCSAALLHEGSQGRWSRKWMFMERREYWGHKHWSPLGDKGTGPGWHLQQDGLTCLPVRIRYDPCHEFGAGCLEDHHRAGGQGLAKALPALRILARLDTRRQLTDRQQLCGDRRAMGV